MTRSWWTAACWCWPSHPPTTRCARPSNGRWNCAATTAARPPDKPASDAAADTWRSSLNLVDTGAAARLTHVNYAFANIDPTNLTCLQGVTKGTTSNPQDPSQGDGAGDAEADYGRPFSAGQSVDGVADSGWEKLQGNYNQLKKLKAKYPNLKVLISIGGWTYSKYFSDVAKTDASRQKFVKSCLDVYIKGNLPDYNGKGGAGTAAGIFDGIDLDWEWPGAEGHPGNHVSPDDEHNNTLLIAEFRKQLDELLQQPARQRAELQDRP